MKKFDIRKHYDLIAAICAVCFVILFLYRNREYFFTYRSMYGGFADDLDTFLRAIKRTRVATALFSGGIISYYIAPIIASLIMAIGLFLKNKKMLIVGAGVGVLLSMSTFVKGLSSLEGYSPSIWCWHWTYRYFIPAVLYISLSVLIICTLNGHKIVKRTWYIPAVLAAASSFLTITFDLSIYYKAQELICNIIQIGMFAFIGLWLKGTLPAPKIAKPKVTVGGADKLKTYKDLLDTGVITQQEYDAKKKEILGL